ncbi:unnamed protein product [Caenorhabditis nigoni]
MNICRGINRCFFGILRFGSRLVGNDKSISDGPVLMKILDKICVTIAIIKTAWIVTFFFTIQLPFEYQRIDFFPYFCIRLFIGLWLTYSVPYHFWKARQAKPIFLPQKSSTGRNCTFCSRSKPSLTSHCRTCDTCIYRRDHHCPWLGQCVGIHNQANFFLFLFNVFLSTVLVLYVEFEFWVENWKTFMEGYNSKMLNPDSMKYSIFTISITISLHLIMISFVVTYVFLVSGGFSIIDSLLKKEGAKPMSLSIIRKRWNQYLTVRRNDSIIRALFVPSDRTVKSLNFH